MSSTSRTPYIIGCTIGAVVAGFIGYAVWFDHRRRNDAEFRREIRKDRKRAKKIVPPTPPSAAGAIDADALKEALAKISGEAVPQSSDDKEAYFMTQVGLGEQLCAQGPMFALPAALHFYRALRVYPSPVELIMIYEKTVPEPVFKIIMDLTNLDVKSRIEGYYEYFPQKRMNVSVKETGESKYKILVAEKDFEAGDVIYKEDPLVVALDSDLQQMGTHCSHCLRLIHKGMAIKPESDRLNAIYCSKECQVASKAESQNLLFTLESPLPPGMDQGLSSLTKSKREEAQKVFTDYLKSTGKTNPLLLARLLARQISLETAKFTPNLPGGIVEPPLTDEGSPGYGISDHIERLRYIDVNALEAERKMITEVLGSALPGLESTLPEDKHALAMGKIAYNAFGVCYSGGRDDKPASAARPEDQERTRTPYGTSRQIGSGLYVVSAYLAHSCEPNVRPSFSSGTAELHLVASRAIKKGDQLTMAFVDVTQHPDETAEQARRRRRFELARGWRFKCECSRCVSDVTDEAEGDLGVGRDESKVEAAVSRVESGQAGIMPDTD